MSEEMALFLWVMAGTVAWLRTWWEYLDSIVEWLFLLPLLPFFLLCGPFSLIIPTLLRLRE